MNVSMRDEPTPWDEYLEYYEDDLDVNEEESKVIMKIGLYRLFSQVKTSKLNIVSCYLFIFSTNLRLNMTKHFLLIKPYPK